MVSKQWRKQNIREVSAERPNNGSRSTAGGRTYRGSAAEYTARFATRNPVGDRGQRAAGEASLVVESGDRGALGRSSAPANSPVVANTMSKNLFIAGTRGVGKTQLLREVTLSKRAKIGGFYTEHIMAGHIRKGFMMRTFDGQERMLAAKNLKSQHQLGKYGVDLNALENVGVPALRLALESKGLIVIDEVGSMEMMSERFRATLLECLMSTKPVLATIRASAQPFSDQVKKFADTETILLTKSNYASVKQQVRKWIEGHL